MRDILLWVAIATLIPGLALRLMLRRYQTEYGRSLTWLNLNYWFTPPWKASTILTSRGVSMFWISTTLIYVGLIAYVITNWVL